MAIILTREPISLTEGNYHKLDLNAISFPSSLYRFLSVVKTIKKTDVILFSPVRIGTLIIGDGARQGKVI